MGVDDFGGFEAVHGGHADIKNDDGELLVKQVPQRLFTRAGSDDAVAAFLLVLRQQCLQRNEAGLMVIHKQDFRFGQWNPLMDKLA